MGHRETTAWELVVRLTEVLLQLGGVRHGATRTIHDEGPMAEPAVLVVDVRAAGVRQELSTFTKQNPHTFSWSQPLQLLDVALIGQCLSEGSP